MTVNNHSFLAPKGMGVVKHWPRNSTSKSLWHGHCMSTMRRESGKLLLQRWNPLPGPAALTHLFSKEPSAAKRHLNSMTKFQSDEGCWQGACPNGVRLWSIKNSGQLFMDRTVWPTKVIMYEQCCNITLKQWFKTTGEILVNLWHAWLRNDFLS